MTAELQLGFYSVWRLVTMWLVVLCVTCTNSVAQNLRDLEQQAFQQAAAQADASIVRVETVGGTDLVGEMLTSTGPTTGVVVREDGYIITSRFHFVSDPASVVVTLPDGERFAAKIVSNDFSRMLTLLKIDATGLAPLVAVPEEEVRVGQWAIALGRTFEPEFPNVAVGIVSAVNRIWGRAIQTDARTSPLNYGGALVDLQGRCLGIIVPLSPQEQGETAGVEWYDSGIGFAVPLTQILNVLPRMIDGETLKPGLMGVGFVDEGPISGAAKIVRVRPESPADKAGLQTDDVITAIGDVPVQKLNDLKHVLGRHYANDVVELSIRRGEETLTKQIELTDELRAYEFPYLGVLARRDAADATEKAAGVTIRTVFPESPAAKAGMQSGDVIESVAGESVTQRDELADQLYRLLPGAEATLKFRRSETIQEKSVTLETLPGSPPDKLSPALIRAPDAESDVAVGRLNEQLGSDGIEFWTWVPENYNPEQGWGLLVWLHPPGETYEAEALKAWSAFCAERGYLLVGPRSGNIAGWSPEQEDQVREVVDWVEQRYRIDPNRVVAMGHGRSGDFATSLAFKHRKLFRGLILLSAPLRIPPPDNDPATPLHWAFVASDKGDLSQQIGQSVNFLQERKFPTWWLKTDDAESGPFPSQVVERLSIWLDAIDRL